MENQLHSEIKGATQLNRFGFRYRPHPETQKWLDTLSIYQLTKMVNEKENFININEFLFQHHFLKNFNTHAILYHSKGKRTAIYKTINRKTIHSNFISLKDFNTSFNHIKKSRNKIFDSGLKSLKNLNIVGQFLAKEIHLNDIAVIFISTNNFMIPADKEEFNKFYEAIEEIKPRLVYGIRNDISEKKYQIEQEIFKLSDSNDQNDKSSEAIHKDKMKLLGDLLNTLRHELNNPIFGLKLACENILLTEENPDFVEYFEQIRQCVDNCTNVITNFSNIYENLGQKTYKLEELIKKILVLTKSVTRNITVQVNNTLSENFEVTVNPIQLTQPIFNIIVNAAHALSEANPSDPFIKLDISGNDEIIKINIKDNGHGIDGTIEDQLFSPFVTTKSFGTGLGLSISKSLIEKLGGEISYDREYKDGASFTLSIPRGRL